MLICKQCKVYLPVNIQMKQKMVGNCKSPDYYLQPCSYYIIIQLYCHFHFSANLVFGNYWPIGVSLDKVLSLDRYYLKLKSGDFTTPYLFIQKRLKQQQQQTNNNSLCIKPSCCTLLKACDMSRKTLWHLMTNLYQALCKSCVLSIIFEVHNNHLCENLTDYWSKYYFLPNIFK